MEITGDLEFSLFHSAMTASVFMHFLKLDSAHFALGDEHRVMSGIS